MWVLQALTVVLFCGAIVHVTANPTIGGRFNDDGSYELDLLIKDGKGPEKEIRIDLGTIEQIERNKETLVTLEEGVNGWTIIEDSGNGQSIQTISNSGAQAQSASQSQAQSA
ncbi:hypothetical protein PV326_007801, partial [Microctonus aethiopoides]